MENLDMSELTEVVENLKRIKKLQDADNRGPVDPVKYAALAEKPVALVKVALELVPGIAIIQEAEQK